MHKNFSICILTDDFFNMSQDIYRKCPDMIICPEFMKNEQQIREWIEYRRSHPSTFVTNSLYLLRELELSDLRVQYRNYTSNGLHVSFDVNDVGTIAILQRELEQSDRYLSRNNT